MVKVLVTVMVKVMVKVIVTVKGILMANSYVWSYGENNGKRNDNSYAKRNGQSNG